MTSLNSPESQFQLWFWVNASNCSGLYSKEGMKASKEVECSSKRFGCGCYTPVGTKQHQNGLSCYTNHKLKDTQGQTADTEQSWLLMEGDGVRKSSS